MSVDPLRGPGSPRIVELLGMPGSGKSTLAKATLAGQRPRPLAPWQVVGHARLPIGDRVDRSMRSLTRALPERLGNPLRRLLWQDRAADFLAVLRSSHPEFLDLVAHAPPPDDADAAHVLQWRSWPLETMETHVLLRRAQAPGETVLVEEGLVMRANTVCAGDERLATRYFGSQPLPDALVVLDVEPNVARQRVSERAKRTLLRHEGRTEQEVLADLERTARLVTTAIDVLRGRGVAVEILDGGEPVEVLRRRLAAFLSIPEARQGPE